jgi:hypothetical protein
VGVELDDEWCHEQTGNIMYDHAAGAAAGYDKGTHDSRKAFPIPCTGNL